MLLFCHFVVSENELVRCHRLGRTRWGFLRNKKVIKLSLLFLTWLGNPEEILNQIWTLFLIRTLPEGKFDKVAAKLTEFNIRGLLIIGGFEVRAFKIVFYIYFLYNWLLLYF